MNVKEFKKNIAASLYILPGSLNELMTREFLKNISSFGVDQLLHQMEKDEWIYYRYEKYYTYKKFATSTEMAEYELL